MKARLF